MDYDVFAGNQHTNTPTHGIYHTAKDTTYFLIFNFPSHIYLYTCSYLYILSSFYPLSPYPFPSLIVPCYYDYFDVLTAPYQRKVIEKIKKNHPTVPTIMYINKVMSPPSTHHHPSPLNHNHHQSYPTLLIKKNHPTVPTIMYINKVYSTSIWNQSRYSINHVYCLCDWQQLAQISFTLFRFIRTLNISLTLANLLPLPNSHTLPIYLTTILSYTYCSSLSLSHTHWHIWHY